MFFSQSRLRLYSLYCNTPAVCRVEGLGDLGNAYGKCCDVVPPLSLPPLSSSYAYAAGVEKPHRGHLRSLRRSRADGAGVAEQDSDHHRR